MDSKNIYHHDLLIGETEPKLASRLSRHEMVFSVAPVSLANFRQECIISSWNTDCLSHRQRWLEESAFRMLVIMHQPTLLLVLYISAILRIAGACSSRSTPRPRPPPPQSTVRPNITFQTYACPEAYAKWYCLNGATCFSVKIGESILYNCECAEGFVGQRCEFKDLEGSYLASRQQVMIETASIAGGVTLLIIILVIISVAVYVHYKKKRKEQMHPVTPVSQAYQPFSAFREPEFQNGEGTLTVNVAESAQRETHRLVGATVHSACSRARTSL